MFNAHGMDWYESLSNEQQQLYDKLESHSQEFSYMGAEHCQEFIDELSGLGITTDKQFEDSFIYQTDSHNPFKEFAQFYVEELCAQDIEDDSSCDWQAVWETQLKNHFNFIEYSDQIFFFIKEEKAEEKS